jgi:hypothetical protein
MCESELSEPCLNRKNVKVWGATLPVTDVTDSDRIIN